MHSATSLESGQGGISEKIRRPKANRGNSWDLLGERPEWEDFNPKNASVENLRFAQGDVGTNKVRSRRIRPSCFMLSCARRNHAHARLLVFITGC